jgi:mono/diheme cytochrome c family protein
MRGQQPPAQGGGQQVQQASKVPLAPEKYLNIQVLKDVPADQLDLAMRFVSAALGVQCINCHVQDQSSGAWAFEKDDKRSKQTAREMMQMVAGINKEFFNGRPTITCASCHAGHGQPNPRPPLAEILTPDQIAAMSQPRPPAPQPGQSPQAQPPLVPVDQVLDKYIEALGGRAALEKLTSRVMSGTVSTRAGQSFAFTVEEKAPDRYRETWQTQPAPMIRAFDGTNGWMQSSAGSADLAGFTLQQALRTADLSLPLKLKEKYESLASRRQTAMIDGKETYVLTGRPSPDVTETLFFEVASGLLVRRAVTTRTPMGPLPEQVDYSDYRDVGGVKMPFEIQRTSWQFLDTLKIADIKANAPIDDSRFVKPKG